MGRIEDIESRMCAFESQVDKPNPDKAGVFEVAVACAEDVPWLVGEVKRLQASEKGAYESLEKCAKELDQLKKWAVSAKEALQKVPHGAEHADHVHTLSCARHVWPNPDGSVEEAGCTCHVAAVRKVLEIAP